MLNRTIEVSKFYEFCLINSQKKKFNLSYWVSQQTWALGDEFEMLIVKHYWISVVLPNFKGSVREKWKGV